MCTGQCVCPQTKKGTSEGKRGCPGQAQSVSANIFSSFCLFVLDMVYLRASSFTPRCSVCCESLLRSKVHSYSPTVTFACTQTRAVQNMKSSVLAEARAFQPGSKVSLPEARTHIVSHRCLPLPTSSPPTGPQGLRLSLRDFLTLSLPPASGLNLSCPRILSTCSSIDHSITAYPPISLYLEHVPQRRREKELVELSARSQNLLHLDFITNRPAPHSLQQKNNNQSRGGKNERKGCSGVGLKGL